MRPDKIEAILAARWGMLPRGVRNYFADAFALLRSGREGTSLGDMKALARSRFETLYREAMTLDLTLGGEEIEGLSGELLRLKFRNLKIAGFALDRLAQVDGSYEAIKVEHSGGVTLAGGDPVAVRNRIAELVDKRALRNGAGAPKQGTGDRNVNGKP